MKREPEELTPPPTPPTALERAVPSFVQIHARPLLVRLTSELVDALKAISAEPVSYLRAAFLPGKLSHSFPARFVREVADVSAALVRHPSKTIIQAFSPDEIGRKRRKSLTIALAASWVVHGVLISYLIYAAIFAPYVGFRVVDNTDYPKFDPASLLPLYYPPQMLSLMAPPQKPESLDDIKKRDAERRRREEILKKQREEEERRKAELARLKAEEERKKAELEAQAKKDQTPKTFGEINVAPIKDIIGNLYAMYQAGNLDVPQNGFSIMCSFKIAPDGSIPRESIHVIKTSKSKVVDTNALEILWQLGQSHALGPLSSLSSNTIELDLNDQVAKVTITSFAQTPDDAKQKVQSLNFLLGVLKYAQKSKNPMVAELLDHLKLTYDNKRINADMTVPKSKATVMMEKQFGKGNQPQ
ncbi:MAG TPA: hypothetical protein VEZ90_13455 [Blastocatellia bacterium]|nr:hypothetical protein [Blastocatellia bacterium]